MRHKLASREFLSSLRFLKKSKGHPYQLRFRIDVGGKLESKRVFFPLKTHSLALAKLKRDTILDFLQSQGVKVKNRKQKR